VGRPSGSRASRRTLSSTLRSELRRELERGQCAYCRAPARPNRPLTREHVIPRARGGRRKDVRIIVAACARCNHSRGSRDFVPFLLERPRRISSFLDYLTVLSPESVRQVDSRIFAELHVAVAIVSECARHGPDWQRAREGLCAGRSLHRRRYAVRRAVRAVSSRAAAFRERVPSTIGPSCILPTPPADVVPLYLEEPPERLASRLLSLLALVWGVPGEVAARELAHALSRTSAESDVGRGSERGDASYEGDPEENLRLDRWAPRPKRPRSRVDRRGGDPSRGRTSRPIPRGRAA
jgi:hypothetical protein